MKGGGSRSKKIGGDFKQPREGGQNEDIGACPLSKSSKEEEMKSIWKYDVLIANFFEIEMPKDAEILSFQTQKNKLQIWAMVDPDNVHEKRIFRIIGTGQDIADNIAGNPGNYIGTAQMENGMLAWHLFEIITEET